MTAKAKSELEQLRADNEELRRQLGLLSEKVNGLTAVTGADLAATRRETLIEKRNRRVREQEEHIEAVARALREGPVKFRCRLIDEPRMGRIVGARDAADAREKYVAYFGIRAIQNERDRFLCEQVSQAECVLLEHEAVEDVSVTAGGTAFIVAKKHCTADDAVLAEVKAFVRDRLNGEAPREYLFVAELPGPAKAYSVHRRKTIGMQ